MERRRILKNLTHHKMTVRGRPLFLDHQPWTFPYPGHTSLKGDVILISTGSKPHRPPEIAFDDINTFDPNLSPDEPLPKSLALAGHR